MFEHATALLDINVQESHETNSSQNPCLDFICPICNIQCIDKTQFYNHLNSHTENVECKHAEIPEGDNKIELQSEVREKLYKNLVRPFKCKQCDLTFDRASQLDYHHRSIHLGEKSQLCEICGKGFFRKTDLRTHLNIHLGTNVCICEICGRKFNHISNLIRHCRMHAGEKPYPCSICGKRFTQISSLARHKYIHERSKERVKQQLHSNYLNVQINKNHALSKDKFVKDNIPSHRKIVKRKHYCRICGESFNFVLLLRQHEKCHSEHTTPSDCKNYEEEAKKLKECTCHTKKSDNKEGKEKRCQRSTERCKESEELNRNKDFHRLKSNNMKKTLPLEAIIHVTSEQLKKINLEHTEDAKNHFLQEHLIEMDGRVKIEKPSSDSKGLNVSEMPVFNRYTETTCINGHHIALHNFNDYEKEESNMYVHKVSKNNDPGKIGIMKDICKIKEDGRIIRSERSLYPYKSHTQFVEQKVVCRPVYDELLCKSKPYSKISNIHGNVECTQAVEPELQKLNEMQNCNVAMHSAVNINEVLRKMDTSINEQIKSDLIIQRTQEISSMQNEGNAENLLGNVNGTTDHEESTLHLVQTETGDQFYEFIINNLSGKLLNAQPSKLSENKFDEQTSISENIKSAGLSTKDVINEQIQPDQNLQEITDIHSDLNYTQYELQGEEKNLTANQTLLAGDPQADFERYVEANLEVFEKLNYESSSERFLEFVEIVENPPGTPSCKDSSIIRSVPNEGEQLFKLLQNSQFIDKAQSQDLALVDYEQKNELITHTNVDSEILITAVEDNTQHELNINHNQPVTKRKKQRQTRESPKGDGKGQKKSQDSKKSQAFLLKFQCTVCEKSFSTSYNYKQHIGTHFADQQKFHCTDCKMTFAWKSTLNKHMANNHRLNGPQKFTCDICPKIYNTLSQVNEHVKRDHLKQRNHICSYCDKSFFKKYDLKIHNRIHTNERPYVCRVCGKRFHHRSHIIRHERIHF